MNFIKTVFRFGRTNTHLEQPPNEAQERGTGNEDIADNMRRELEELRGKLEEERLARESAEQQCRKLESRISEESSLHRRELRKIVKQRDQAYGDLNLEKSARESIGASHAALAQKLRGAEEESGRLRESLKTAEGRLKRAQTDLAYERNKGQALTEALEQSQSLSQTRAKELRDVQAVLAIDNETPESDVLRIIVKLNEAIYQCSAQLVEDWGFNSEDLQPRHDAKTYLTQLVGQQVADVLFSAQGEGKEIAIQLAIQTSFVQWVYRAISTWDLGSPLESEENNRFMELHKHILQNEEQRTGGKWRSLTIRYLDSLRVSDIETQVRQRLQRTVSDILVVGGAKSEETYDELDRRRGSDIEEIVRLIFDAREAIRQKVVSCTFEPFVVGFGERFDTEVMEDEYKDTRGGKCETNSGVVFCTLGVGLRRWERCAVDDASGEGVSKQSIPLKSKIVLESQLLEVIGGESPESTPTDDKEEGTGDGGKLET